MKIKSTHTLYFLIVILFFSCNKGNKYEGNWEIKSIVVDTNLIPENINAITALGLFFMDRLDKPTNIVFTKDSILLMENNNLLQGEKIQETTKIGANKFNIVFGNNSGVLDMNEPSSANFTVNSVKYSLEKN